MKTNVLDYWNARAQLNEKAGSDDLIAKSIEIEAIAKLFANNIDVMEFGCGNGITALEMAKRYDIKLDAYDFSPEMIASAQKLAERTEMDAKVAFHVGDIRNPPAINKLYDLIFTERMIINLANWDEQQAAIAALCKHLKPSGRLLLVENSADGLNNINKMRIAIGLSEITPPWHNIYLIDEKVERLKIEGVELVQVVSYSSTYYFISRVINAWQAKQAGEEPRYDAAVNRLALSLPSMGDLAQGKIWIFEKS